MLEKRGMSKVAISIIIVLVVLVAAILIYNFSVKEKVIPPNPIIVQCQNQCDAGSKTGFCDVERRVTETLVTTCQELSTNSAYVQYGVQACPTISCSTQGTGETQTIDQTCISGLGGTWESPDASGGCEQYGSKIRRKLASSDNSPTEGQICCR